MKTSLPADSQERKDTPVFSGCIMYFPAALAGVARHSKRGNDKHNPGQPLHHARGKSMDHSDCVTRHSMDIADMEAAGERGPLLSPVEIQALLEEADALCWRALAWSQALHEKYGGAPLAPAARPAVAAHPLIRVCSTNGKRPPQALCDCEACYDARHDAATGV